MCCKLCKTLEMVDVFIKRCLCGKATPSFGEAGGKAVCCKRCKLGVLQLPAQWSSNDNHQVVAEVSNSSPTTSCSYIRSWLATRPKNATTYSCNEVDLDVIRAALRCRLVTQRLPTALQMSLAREFGGFDVWLTSRGCTDRNARLALSKCMAVLLVCRETSARIPPSS